MWQCVALLSLVKFKILNGKIYNTIECLEVVYPMRALILNYMYLLRVTSLSAAFNFSECVGRAERHGANEF